MLFMKRLFIILSFGLLTNVYGQDITSLEKKLTEEFSEKSMKDGQWVYYADNAEIKKVKIHSIKTIIPSYNFYKVNLTNYLGYHVNKATCVVAIDSLTSAVLLIEPLWFGDINEPFLKLLTKKRCENKTHLLEVLEEATRIMEIGSSYRFVLTGSTDNLVTFDLVHFKGDSYTTSGKGTSSTVQYKKDGVWREIEIEIDGMEIVQYKSTNPKTKDEVVVK
jgi:hypothetical protein